MTLSTVVMIAAVCVLVEAFFSGSEIAIVSASRAALRSKAQSGDRGARLVERYLERPQTLLATTLLGTNMATITFSVTVTLFLVDGNYSGGEILAVLMVTPMTLVFGEVVPKTFCQQHSDELVTRLVYPLHVASLVLRPAVWVMSGFAGGMSRIFGVERQRAFVTREELALLIEAEPGRHSEITEHEREMISNVLEMSEATVGSVMVPLSEVTALPEDTTVVEAVREIADKQHSRMPVYRGRIDDVVGVLHVFDLLQVGAVGSRKEINELARPVTYVPETKSAVELLVELQGSGDQLTVVVDEYGGAVGIVTVEDLLEEIVGEIDDEHDDVASQIVVERPGVWKMEARVSVERVNEELGLDLPEEDEFESMAGLILSRLKRIPDPGESLVIGNVTIRVTEANERAIEKIQILRARKR